jgi:molybdenum cofactor cytidylyltransferase
MVLSVDQPRLASILRRLLREHGGGITVPVHAGHRGHPVILGGSLLSEMLEVRDETLGLRAVIERHEAEVREIEFGSDEVLLDLNEPPDYESARPDLSV